MTSQPCRWGILGAATIARKNWQAIHDAGNATLVAVASRDPARSAAFVADCQAQVPFAVPPAALESYEALLSRPDIDAVYLPLPTGIRKHWVMRAVRSGKHVLVEKPSGCNAAEVREIITSCADHRVQFMDGVMFMHGARLRRLRAVLDDKRRVGSIRHIASQFSFAGDEAFLRDDIRTHGMLEPLGCLGDLGWYCIRFTLWSLGFVLPLEVTGRVCSEYKQAAGLPGVPLEFSGNLHFAEGVSATFYCSFTARDAQWSIISGTEGLVQVPDFVLPFSGPTSRFSVIQSRFAINGCRFEMHEGREEAIVDEPSNNAPESQEALMFRTFSEQVRVGRIDPSWSDIALKTQLVLDACLESARRNSTPVRVG